MTTTTDTAESDQDEPGSGSSSDSDIPPEPPRARARRASIGAEGLSVGAATLRGEPIVDVSLAFLPGAKVKVHLDTDWLISKLREALDHITQSVVRVSLLIVDEQRMRDLHRQHMGVDKTTDVLAFPASDSGDAIDADIALCIDEAQRQAEHRNHPLVHELLLYALHGLLHCAGFDDHNQTDYEAMHAEENRIFRLIGLEPIFSIMPGADGDRGASPTGGAGT